MLKEREKTYEEIEAEQRGDDIGFSDILLLLVALVAFVSVTYGMVKLLSLF